MVDSLATKYVEARKGLDDRIEELQAENKGLVDKAISAIKAVVGTIRELISMLTNVLSRAAGVVGEIIKNPIGFLGNLIAGIKGGILKFKDNILDHLRKGLMSWLFGALAEGGIELPDTFDVKGVIKLLASIFGLTWANIRNRIVRQIGEKAMAAAEKGVEIFQTIASQGIAGLWHMLVDKLGDIKEMILEQAKDFVITKIITAGITWLIGLLNPAAAFIKACKLIYDVVMFFVNNASRILKFVNTVLDSVADIVRGNISGVVDKIDDVLGQMVPIIIGFLASVIGLGGIGDKIREIIQALQKPVNKALDFIIKTGLKLAGPIIRGLKGISGKIKAKVAAGKAWVKGKATAAKKWAKTGVVKLRSRFTGKKEKKQDPEATARRLASGMSAAVAAVNRFAGKPVTGKILTPLLAAIRLRYRMSAMRLIPQADVWAVHGVINPKDTRTTQAKKSKVDPAKVRAAIAHAQDAYVAAMGRHEEIVSTLNAKGTKSAAKTAKRVTVASDGTVFRTQGGRTEENLEAGQNDPDLDTQKQAGQIWLEADAARWEATGPVTRRYANEMTKLTPAANQALKVLNKNKQKNMEKIDEIMRRPSSYVYPGKTLAEREAHFAKTGEYIPRRSSQDFGVPGATSSVHAEKLLRSTNGAQAIGVSRLQCRDCQLWFRAAATRGDFIVVFDGKAMRIFMPDGSVKGPRDFA